MKLFRVWTIHIVFRTLRTETNTKHVWTLHYVKCNQYQEIYFKKKFSSIKKVVKNANKISANFSAYGKGLFFIDT